MPDKHPIVERKGQECPDCGFQAEGRGKTWCPRCKEGLLFDIVFEHPTGPTVEQTGVSPFNGKTPTYKMTPVKRQNAYQCHDCGQMLEGEYNRDISAHVISPCSRCIDLANDLGLRGRDLNNKNVRR